MHSHLHLSSFQCCLLLQTLLINLHLDLHISCYSLRLVSLVPDTRLNTLTFTFFTTSGTHNFAHGLLILLQLPLHLFVLILRRRNTGSSPLTLTIYNLTLHFWLFVEIQLNEFMLVKVDKNINPLKKHFLINPSILLYYVILFH